MQKGDQITILKPVSPHIEGNGTITKVDEGKLKYEVEQWDIKQWYEETQITDRLIKVEPAPEFPKNICDQYKEAISEVTEDLKESSVTTIHKRDDIDFQLSEIFKRQSTSTTMFPNGITGLNSDNWGNLSTETYPKMIGENKSVIGKPFKTCAEIYGNTFMTTQEKEITKRALALLAEKKQNEIKEIEELIKKL